MDALVALLLEAVVLPDDLVTLFDFLFALLLESLMATFCLCTELLERFTLLFPLLEELLETVALLLP